MKNNSENFLSIPTWAEEDRPREKLLLKGNQYFQMQNYWVSSSDQAQNP